MIVFPRRATRPGPLGSTWRTHGVATPTERYPATERLEDALVPMSAYPVGAYEQRIRPGFRPKAVRPDLPLHSGRDHRKVPLRDHGTRPACGWPSYSLR